MTDQSASNETPSRRNLPRWLIYVGIAAGAVVLCVLICWAATILVLLSPAIHATRLPSACMENNPDMDRAACEAWSDDVQQYTIEYHECFQQGASEQQYDAQSLYDCLVEKGVGPE
ncbi:MAG: hypothetical protein JXJ17_00240 [Anaerolineae bacterium]|nr:hypothetical protein [Anaerolineae bacterium]